MASELPAGTTAPRGLPPPNEILWRLVPARDLFELKYGRALVESLRRAGDVPVYGTNGRCGSHDTSLFKAPGVILGRKGQGHLGVEWCGHDYWVIDTAYTMIPLRDDIDLGYGYYLISHIGLNHLKDGTSNPTLSREAFGVQALPLPPLEVQVEISAFLRGIDDRIGNLRQTNTTLEAIVQTLFKSWFVDFDPVRAKSEGREPKGMDAATAALFPNEFESSEFGPIPIGWRRISFGDVATLSKGSVSPMAEPVRDFRHYSLPAFDAGQLPLIEPGESIKSNKTPVPSDAVLVSKLNPHIPRIWFVGDVGPDAVCSTEFLVWTPRPGVGSAFVYALASSTAFNTAMRQLVTGTSNSHQRVRPGQLAEVQAAVISDDALAKFEAIVAPMSRQVEHNRRLAATLAEVRDALLPRLVSGKLRLPETAAAFEELSKCRS